MKTVIIEDELPQAHRLRQMLEGTGFPLEVLAVMQSVREAVDFLSANPVDLIFLDIHLADGLCFGIFEKVRVTCPVIFTTAYDQYAIEAFRHNGIDYLLKPVSNNELKKSLDKFIAFTSPVPDYLQVIRFMKEAVAGMKNYKKRFITQSGRKLKIITTDDIAYFYALAGGVFVRTIRNENLLITEVLETLGRELDPYEFFRLNRKIIARVSSIKEMLPYSKSRIKVILNPAFGEDVIISYQHVKDFLKWVRQPDR
jgi:DNA-binding LytR/AlgR family response regulator